MQVSTESARALSGMVARPTPKAAAALRAVRRETLPCAIRSMNFTRFMKPPILLAVHHGPLILDRQFCHAAGRHCQCRSRDYVQYTAGPMSRIALRDVVAL